MSTERKTVTLHHPTLLATVDVDEKDVQSWSDQGWLKSRPKAVAEHIALVGEDGPELVTTPRGQNASK
jgi:hypothetical protein